VECHDDVTLPSFYLRIILGRRAKMKNIRKTMRRIGVTVIIGVAVAACGSSGATQSGDKVGNQSEPITLTLGSQEHAGSPGAAAVEAFVSAVAAASGGRITIKATLDVHTTGLAWDQDLIKRVVAGEFDLVMARAGAWHSEGVGSLDVLQLPGIVETDEQADRLVSNQAVVDQLLSGIDKAGMVGLGLYPDAPRYLMSLDGNDKFDSNALRDRLIRVPMSETVFDVLRAVGMSPVDLSFDDFTTQVSEGRITFTDNSFYRVPRTNTVHGEPPIVAANLTLHTKFLVLAGRPAALDALPDAQAKLVRDAAVLSMAEFVKTRERESDLLAGLCANGTKLVDVPDADRAEFMAQAAPVVASVSSALGDDLMASVRASVGPFESPHWSCQDTSTPAETTVVGAASSQPDAATMVLPTKRSDVIPTPGDLPDGVYRFTETVAVLDAAEPNKSHTKADEFIGEFVLSAGTSEIRYFAMDGSPQPGEPPDTGGTYQVKGDLVIFATPPQRAIPGTSGINLLRWAMNGDTLTFTQLDDHTVDPDFSVPWIRVGDAP
jgi:TRAP-type C4-dicarboxylate transport system substrate-binding protein